jgi:hypothetical protein
MQSWNLGSWWSLDLLHEQAKKRSGGYPEARSRSHQQKDIAQAE